MMTSSRRTLARSRPSLRAVSALTLTFGVVVGCAPTESAEQGDANPLVGAWQLVSWENRAPDGTVSYPYEGNATGQITYTATGRMSAQLMQRDRDPFPTAQDEGVTVGDVTQAILGSFFSYYGRYSIDHENDVVTHHVEGALLPQWVGRARPRSFVFDGPDRVTLSTDVDPNRTSGAAVGVLVWERINRD